MSQLPDISFAASGPQVPDAPEVLAWVQARFQEAFGPELNLDQSTPQGQLITTLTACIVAKTANFFILRKCSTPTRPKAFFRDALGRIYFLNRQAAASSVADCLCVGLPGTVIPGTDGTRPRRWLRMRAATMALHEDRHDPRKRESDVALCERRYRPHPMPGAKHCHHRQRHRRVGYHHKSGSRRCRSGC